MKILESDCPTCEGVHRWDPADCTITLEKGRFWLHAACPDREAPVRLWLAKSAVVGLAHSGTMFDPAVRDRLDGNAKAVDAQRNPWITPTNLHTLDKLTEFIAEEGRYPALRELGEVCGVGITAAAWQVRALKAKGIYPPLPEPADSGVAP